MLNIFKNTQEFRHYGEKVLVAIITLSEVHTLLENCSAALLSFPQLNEGEVLYKVIDNGKIFYLFMQPNITGKKKQIYEFYRMPGNYFDLETLVYDIAQQKDGKRPMDTPTSCKKLLKCAYAWAYEKYSKNNLDEAETEVYSHILSDEREKFLSSYSVEKRNSDILNPLLMDSSSRRAELKFIHLLAAKYIYRAGYNAEYFWENDTHDIYFNQMEDVLNALNDLPTLNTIL